VGRKATTQSINQSTAVSTQQLGPTREELFGNSLGLFLGLQCRNFEVIGREAEVELGVLIVLALK